jgi:pilus assembly protein CpaE
MTGGALEAAGEVQRDPPDLLVLDAPTLDESDLALLESSLLSAPSTAMVLLSPDRSSDFLIRAMRAGVREVIPSPPPPSELSAALARQLERLGLQRLGAPVGTVIALVPAKGGSGATFIATSLAAELASRGARTLLMDLNAPFGDAALHLVEQRPSATLADLARQVGRLDATLLESVAVEASDGLSLLAAPDSIDSFAQVGADAFERILALARARFRFVLLDLGRSLDPVTVRGLDRADRIMLIAQPSLPYLHAARRVLDLFDGLGYGSDRVYLVLNRFERGIEPSADEASRMLGVKVSELIPNSYRAVGRAINNGQPIRVSAPRDPVAKALAALADRLLAQQRPGRGDSTEPDTNKPARH